MTNFMASWANSAAQIETEKRRLECLRYLAQTSGYEATATLLRLNCHRIGVPSTADQLLAALCWLAEAELITLRDGSEPIARLTVGGRDVAEGIRSYPGVMRPDP